MAPAAPLGPYTEPLQVLVEDGFVVIIGPGFEMPMTPEATLRSIEKMRRAAEEALRQLDAQASD